MSVHLSIYLVVYGPFSIFEFELTSSVFFQHRNVFIRLVLSIYLQLSHTYVQKKAYKSMFHFMAQTSYKYDSFSIQSVIFSWSFIVIFFTSVLLAVLNSNFWLYFIMIFDFYDLNDNIIDEIPMILISLVLIITSINTLTGNLFFLQNNIVVSPLPLLIVFLLYLSLSSLRMSMTTVGITDYIGISCLGDHIIATYNVCFSPGTIVSYHRNHCWLLFFVVGYLGMNSFGKYYSNNSCK